MLKRNDINIISKRVAKKLDLPENKVWNVVHSLFEYISSLVESGKWEGFHMRFLGKFVVKPFRLEVMQKKLADRMSRDSISINDSEGKEDKSILDDIVNNTGDEQEKK